MTPPSEKCETKKNLTPRRLRGGVRARSGRGGWRAGCKFNQLLIPAINQFPIPAKAGISLSSNCFWGAVSERQLEIGEIPAFAGMEREAGMEEGTGMEEGAGMERGAGMEGKREWDIFCGGR